MAELFGYRCNYTVDLSVWKCKYVANHISSVFITLSLALATKTGVTPQANHHLLVAEYKKPQQLFWKIHHTDVKDYININLKA